MSNTITWYFDFISPFSYLQQARFGHFPKEIVVQAKPILFAGLLVLMTMQRGLSLPLRSG